MGVPIHEPRSGRLAWLGPASCAVVAVGVVAFYATTHLSFNFSYGETNSGFGFNFASSMDLWYHVCLLGLFLAGAALGGFGIARATRLRPLAWVGAVANVLCAVLLATFLGAALYQGAPLW